jgi:excisionase family DNA binding protein
MSTITWLTAREAAEHLRVAHRTVLLWAKLGRIPAHKLSGAARVTWRFRADELDAILTSPTEQTGDE